MISVARIESLIDKLSLAEQRLVAQHLDEHLAEAKKPAEFPAADEGIRFLVPYECCPAPGESRSRKRRQKAETAR